MQEILDKIIAEIQDNLIIPDYSDAVVKDIAAFVLTVAFAMLQETSADLVSKNTTRNKR